MVAAWRCFFWKHFSGFELVHLRAILLTKIPIEHWLAMTISHESKRIGRPRQQWLLSTSFRGGETLSRETFENTTTQNQKWLEHARRHQLFEFFCCQKGHGFALVPWIGRNPFQITRPEPQNTILTYSNHWWELVALARVTRPPQDFQIDPPNIWTSHIYGHPNTKPSFTKPPKL